MTFFVGIDGGQSSTVAVVGDERGCVVGRGTAGPADEVAQGPDSTRLRDALHEATANALRSGGIDPTARCAAIVAGVSGFEGHIRGVTPDLPTDRSVIMHDAPIAHAGALGGLPGVVVIAGTGSVAYRVRDGGRVKTFGGWGYLFGDEGSAFWMARNAIAHAMTHVGCESVAPILEFFGSPSLRVLVRDVYDGSISRARVAAFAAVCIESAQKGEGCFSISTAASAIALAQLVAVSLADAEETLPVAFVGGLMNDPWFKQLVYGHTRAQVLGVAISEPRYEPVYGALLLAYKEGGVPIQRLLS